ncbi:helix-turn-helix domain-containing protein [Paenibacillus thalictri]|uniref:Helix-turn-helix domain-containing protein n=1 Tax=Paenibacillus thalictri TaxID=2527873 RepID=A0A4Q9DGN8_9BACL|nr:helix-turn-helix domain-containing protein [Paenibacillus thalictri]
MKLIIVEDELRLRNSIAYLIPWESRGLEVIGVYGDGIEGWQAIERMKPDVLLLDIEVPGMGGLQLAERALTLGISMKIVILSGHDDFKFAQTAVSLGVSQYLLKPAGDTEILAAVTEAAEQLRKERESQYERITLERKWAEHIPRLQENFLQNWISGRYEPWEITRKSEEFRLPARSETVYAAVAAEIDPLAEDETRFTAKDQELLRFTLLCLAKDFTAESNSCIVFHDYGGLTVLVFAQNKEESENAFINRVNGAATHLLSLVQDCLKLTASAGIGSPCAGSDIRRSYMQAVQALQERMIYGINIVIPFREESAPTLVSASVQHLERKLEAAMQTGDPAATAAAADELFHEAIGKAETTDQIAEYVIILKSLLIRVIQSKGWSLRDVVEQDYDIFHKPELLQSKEQIRSWLLRTVRQIAEYGVSRRHKSHHEFIRAALALIEEQLDQDISLYAMADRLHVSSSYLSHLFKQEVGTPFSQYVIRRKMEHAKELLLGGAKVYDAVLKTGFRDISYFTKVFRKIWGITPGECKRK